MKKLLLISFGLFVVVLLFSNLKPKNQNPSISYDFLPLCSVGCERVNHSFFTLCYNENHEQAAWVYYVLNDNMITGSATRKNYFSKDSLVSTGSASYYDYKNSGFDRGHLLPAADMKWSQKAMDETFFMSNMNEKEEEDVVAIENIRNAVKYIANELLENAMKFQNKTVPFTAKIQFSLYHNKLVFCVTNGISEQQLESLQTFIKKLLNGEPEKLYIETMKANAWQANNTMTSGLGLLSMICDYSAKLGWKFEKQTDPPLITVTTVVCLDL